MEKGQHTCSPCLQNRGKGRPIGEGRGETPLAFLSWLTQRRSGTSHAISTPFVRHLRELLMKGNNGFVLLLDSHNLLSSLCLSLVVSVLLVFVSSSSFPSSSSSFFFFCFFSPVEAVDDDDVLANLCSQVVYQSPQKLYELHSEIKARRVHYVFISYAKTTKTESARVCLFFNQPISIFTTNVSSKIYIHMD